MGVKHEAQGPELARHWLALANVKEGTNFNLVSVFSVLRHE